MSNESEKNIKISQRFENLNPEIQKVFLSSVLMPLELHFNDNIPTKGVIEYESVENYLYQNPNLDCSQAFEIVENYYELFSKSPVYSNTQILKLLLSRRKGNDISDIGFFIEHNNWIIKNKKQAKIFMEHKGSVDPRLKFRYLANTRFLISNKENSYTSLIVATPIVASLIYFISLIKFSK